MRRRERTGGLPEAEPPSEDPRPAADLDDIVKRASSAERQGDIAGALHILREAGVDNLADEFGVQVVDGVMQITRRADILSIKARAAYLSLISGQWSNSPHHGPSSDTPHGYLTLYESLNPVIPEANPRLRFDINRLRIAVAADHENWVGVAAWAMDQIGLCEGLVYPDAKNDLGAYEATGNLAVALSHLGFKESASVLYQRLAETDKLPEVERAGVLINLGSWQWNQGDAQGAEKRYSHAIGLLRSKASPTLIDLHELVRALVRRADCLVARGDFELALEDLEAACASLDGARLIGVYQSARSVDVPVRNDIVQLVISLSEVPAAMLSGDALVRMLLILGNSSAASRLRDGRPRRDAREEVLVDAGCFGPTSRASVVSARFWRPVADADVESLMANPNPTMLCTIARKVDGSPCGVSVLVGGGGAAAVKTWSLGSTSQYTDRQLLEELVAPPPGTSDTPLDGAWPRPWNFSQMNSLATQLFPMAALEDRVSASRAEGLRIVPIGSMWRFPFSALPLFGQPAASALPIVLSPGPVLNVRRPTSQRWVGHFDLTLAGAVADVQNVVRITASRGLHFDFFGDPEELTTETAGEAVSLLVFAGHGGVGGGGHRLLLASGRACEAAEFEKLCTGANVVLNACWSGYVRDDFGSDASQAALQLLVNGSHSVLGTMGPVNDQRAGELLAEVLPGLAQGLTMAEAYRIAVRNLLGAEPGRPLSSWASYATIGRDVAYHEEPTKRSPGGN